MAQREGNHLRPRKEAVLYHCDTVRLFSYIRGDDIVNAGIIF